MLNFLIYVLFITYHSSYTYILPYIYHYTFISLMLNLLGTEAFLGLAAGLRRFFFDANRLVSSSIVSV